MDNERIRDMAIRIVSNLGLPPFDMVMATRSDTLTPAEKVSGTGLHDDYIEVDRWETYRSDAAMAIAMFEAVSVDW